MKELLQLAAAIKSTEANPETEAAETETEAEAEAEAEGKEEGKAVEALEALAKADTKSGAAAAAAAVAAAGGSIREEMEEDFKCYSFSRMILELKETWRYLSLSLSHLTTRHVITCLLALFSSQPQC